MKASESDVEYDMLLEDDSSDDGNDPNSFRVVGALDPPHHTTYTTKKLHEEIHEGHIDLNPPYQRDVVWPVSKQTSLIDSLWNNYHIPSIVFVARYEEGERMLVCVDGKQVHLTSIPSRQPQTHLRPAIDIHSKILGWPNCMYDLVSLHSPTYLLNTVIDKVGKKFWWFTLPDKSKANHFEIPQKWKEIFHSKEIVCDIYNDLTEECEREMFRRVQLAMTLTAAEKLKAVSSPMATWIAYLERKHVEIEDGLARVLSWDLSRGKSFHNVMQMVYCCDGYPEERMSFSTIGKWLEGSAEPLPCFQKDMDKVLVDFWKIASDKQMNHAFAKSTFRVAPVEFIFIGVLLYAIREHDLRTKAHATNSLRKAIRATHVDIRTNTKVAKTMWAFVKYLQRHPLREITVKGSLRGGTGNAKKRKTKQDDDDDDYRG